IAFSPDGSMVASASAINTGDIDPYRGKQGWYRLTHIKQKVGELNVWDVHTKRKIAEFVLRSGNFGCFAFSPDGRLIASGGDGGLVLVLSIPECHQVWRVGGHIGNSDFPPQVWAVAFSHDGRLLLSADRAGLLLAHDVSTRRQVRRLRAHATDLNGLAC